MALARWKPGPLRAGLPGWVPDCDLVGQPGFGVLDLRAPDNLDGSGLCIAVDAVGSDPIPGALLQLGDDAKGKLGAVVRTALSNRLGINPSEATPGRIAAEILILRADGKAWCNPLQREFGAIRDRIMVAGLALYDSLDGDPDAVATYYADTFTGGTTLTWSDPSASTPFVVVSNQARPNAAGSGAFWRADHDVGGSNMFAQGDYTIVSGSSGGPYARIAAAANTGYQMDHNVGGYDYVRWAAGAYNYISSATGTISITSGVAATLYLQANGSSLLGKVGANNGSAQTDTNVPTGTRGGMVGYAASSAANFQVDNFVTAQIGETPGNPTRKRWGGIPFAGGATRGRW